MTKLILLQTVVDLYYTQYIKMLRLVKGGRLSKCSKTFIIKALRRYAQTCSLTSTRKPFTGNVMDSILIYKKNNEIF